MGYSNSAQREIDLALREVSQELEVEELGSRRRSVYYRNRFFKTGENFILGKPGVVDSIWIKISPTPRSYDVRREFIINNVTQINIGDIEIHVDRLTLDRNILNESEYYMSDDADSQSPTIETKANYDLINGSVREGSSNGKNKSFWVCNLRKRQIND